MVPASGAVVPAELRGDCAVVGAHGLGRGAVLVVPGGATGPVLGAAAKGENRNIGVGNKKLLHLVTLKLALSFGTIVKDITNLITVLCW